MDETTDAGAEMTEEEWNLRVAELNKHQVGLCNLKLLWTTTKYNVINHINKDKSEAGAILHKLTNLQILNIL